MKRFLSALLIVSVLAVFLPVVVFAQGDVPPEPTMLENILEVLVGFANLAGVSAAISAIVNVLKTIKVVQDDTAGKWVAGLNLVAIGGLVYLKLFQPQILFETIDAQAAVFAQIILIVLGYIVQLGFGMFTHGVLSSLRVPLIGKSFSLNT